MNDSILSNSSQAAYNPLGRVVNNIVDMQQQLVNQFSALTTQIDSLKSEVRSSVSTLREDSRRADERCEKQLSEIRQTHKEEVQRLLDLINNLVAKQSAPAPAPAPSQQSYGAAQNPAAFFGGMQDPQGMMRMMQMQYQQHQQAALQQQQQQQAAQAVMQQQAAMAAAAASQISTPPKPIAVTPVQLPQPTMPVIAPNKPIAALKTDEKPPILTPQAPKPAISFASTQSTTPASSLFGGLNLSKPAAATPNASSTTSIFGTPAAAPKPTTTGSPIAPLAVKPQSTPKAEEEEDDDKVEEYEPDVQFKPVIPLPELVEVVTGEEGEKVLFEDRCKLYRFAEETKEWKERGTGVIKVLENNATSKVRIVMRRDQTVYRLVDGDWLAQVHKVCANHQLAGGMTITPMSKSDKACTWFCDDYAEEEPTHERLSARFANKEKCDEFMKVFKTTVEKAGDASPVKADKPDVSKKEEPKKEDKKADVKIEQGFGDKFKLKEGSWECPGCYATNTSDQKQCPCCNTRPGGTMAEANPFANKLAAPPAPAAGQVKFSFGMSAAAAAKDPLPTSSPAAPANKPLFGGAATPTFGFGGKTAPVFGASLAKTESASTSTTASPVTFSFAAKTAAGDAPADSAPVAAAAAPIKFSFTPTATTSATSSSASVFGGSSKLFGNSAAVGGDSASASPAPSSTNGSVFSGSIFGGAPAAGGNLFATGKTGTNIFEGAAAEKAREEFSKLQKSKPFNTSATPKKDDDDEDDGAEEEYEPDVEFKPVIPLPDLVEVKTGEEDEECMFSARCKLYRYVKETKENKERGVGDIKILKHKETQKYRVVMRREQVHKLCANFSITPEISVTQRKYQPQVYNWTCMDFAEEADGSMEVLTAKFKTEEIGAEFAKKFQDAQADLQ